MDTPRPHATYQLVPPTTVVCLKDTRLRSLKQDNVDKIAASMRQLGKMLNPITLRRGSGRGLYLVSGLHRLEAARKLKWDEIPAIIFEDLKKIDEALLAEIDENLMRGELSPAEQAAHHAKRKELYEKLHPRTKHGGNPGGGKGHGKKKDLESPHNADSPNSYTEDAAVKTGKSRSTVERAVARGRAIPDIAELAGTSLDNGYELDALARLPESEQRDLIAKAKAGEQVTARTEEPMQEDQHFQELMLILEDARGHCEDFVKFIHDEWKERSSGDRGAAIFKWEARMKAIEDCKRTITMLK